MLTISSNDDDDDDDGRFQSEVRVYERENRESVDFNRVNGASPKIREARDRSQEEEDTRSVVGGSRLEGGVRGLGSVCASKMVEREEIGSVLGW
jgi:hypothetical protein